MREDSSASPLKPRELDWEEVERVQAERRERPRRLRAWCRDWGCPVARVIRLLNVHQGSVRSWMSGRRHCAQPRRLINLTREVEAQWRMAHPGQPDPGPVFFVSKPQSWKPLISRK